MKKDAALSAEKSHAKRDEELSPELYEVARKKGTEASFSGKYWASHEKGMYKCAICGAELFSSETKFDSGTGWPRTKQRHAAGPRGFVRGWPSFTEPANLENIELKPDFSGGMTRTEVLCKKCGAHLGHVFDGSTELTINPELVERVDDGPHDKGGKRYCINSVCLDFEKK